MSVKYEGKTVYFTTQPVVFNFEVGDLIETDNAVVVRLNIPADDDTRRNVFAMKKNAEFIWQVESSLEHYPEINVELPYENMALLNNGNISVSDFFGRTFEVDINTGKLLNFKVSR
ncbi:hypothetical protein IKE67_03225 [bacterium]|nr:hypothetical protein [bacterium]